MKLKLTFDKEKKDVIAEILKNEAEQFLIKFNKSKTMNIRSWIARRKYGINIQPTFTYEIVSGTEALVEVNTGLDWLADKKRFLKSWKDYESAAKEEGWNLTAELVEEKE